MNEIVVSTDIFVPVLPEETVVSTDSFVPVLPEEIVVSTDITPQGGDDGDDDVEMEAYTSSAGEIS